MNTAPRRSARIAAAPTRWWLPSQRCYTTAPGQRAELENAYNQRRRLDRVRNLAMVAAYRLNNDSPYISVATLNLRHEAVKECALSARLISNTSDGHLC